MLTQHHVGMLAEGGVRDMKKLSIAISSTALVLSGWMLAIPAHAASCTTVSTSRGTLTTAVHDPLAPVTGEVDASGCDIGVYVDSGHVTITNATVHDANHFGVFNDGANVTV